MNKTVLIFFAAAASLAACSTPTQTVGTATGVAAGAVVGGPVGAVVGGVAGAAVTTPGTPLNPGYCYVRGANGDILHHADGRPRVRRC